MVRGLFLCETNGNSGEEGGLCEIPSVVGLWIFSGATWPTMTTLSFAQVSIEVNMT